MTEARVQIVPKMIQAFSHPYGSMHYRIFKGGRGSGKTKGCAKMCAIIALQHAVEGKSGVILCGREFMISLEDSTLAEIKWAIESEPELLAPWFDVGEKYVRTKGLPGRVDFKFVGLRHNIDSLKSKAEVLLTWIDEAETVSETAYRKLMPTIARFKGELFLSYNPESPDSATHTRFVKNPTDKTVICTVNWNDNPWHDERMEAERLLDLRDRPDLYHHIWEGEFLTMTEAQVFSGKYKSESLEPPAGSTPYIGLDFGFSTDPSACVKIYKIGRVLLWRKEFYSRGILINDLGGKIRSAIGDDVTKYDVIADSARPDDIAYLKQPISVSGGSCQLPRIKGAGKGRGSVEAGVEFIKSHDNIIHPDCPNVLKEFKMFSYRVDKQSDQVLPVLAGGWDHAIDAGRYALEPIMRNSRMNWKAMN